MWALRRLDMRWLQCALCFYLLAQICDAVSLRRDISTASGCFHNSTLFADTSIIPSTEPCLLCKCSNKNLVCVRRVCKDQPYPPPRSCVIVHKKSICCPYLSCSKYHINYYKNSERNQEQLNRLQVSHEKTLEKSSRTDDAPAEMNGGCIESGSMYASGSAMVRSSSSPCSYCYCLNGQQKCIKPKCELQETKCKPVFMEASCCPVKYDCSRNETLSSSHLEKSESHNHVNAKRRNRSNGCFESEKYYQEGEKLPSDHKRPCEMCYCIKGFRKCVVKKCAPLIRGCIPKIPKEGNCCPTSYDCSRSLKRTRQIRQNADEEPEEDNESIDFFSLLFGSDEPPEEKMTEEQSVAETTTLLPFKALPSTEKSFFDLIRAGLEIIDANADKINSQINEAVTTPRSIEENTVKTNKTYETTTKNFIETTERRVSSLTRSTHQPTSTTIKLPEKFSTEPTTLSSSQKVVTTVASSTTRNVARITAAADITAHAKVSSTTMISPTTKTKAASPTKQTQQTTELLTTRKLLTPSTSTTTEKLQETTSKVLIETTSSPSTIRATLSLMPTTTEGHQRLDAHFEIPHPPDDNEAETIPNIEIIPFVAFDAIDTDKFDAYLKPYDNLEKDYFANDKEKPFRYNNKFIHHSYDDSADYAYPSPHERIDNGPYYFETNDNQFDSFSPPSEQDFLGGFSPKETIFDEASTIASHELPLHNNELLQKPLDALTTHEHKSNVTSAKKTLTSYIEAPINQTSHKSDDVKQQHNVIPEIASNFTSFFDELLEENVLGEKPTTKQSTTSIKPTTTSTAKSTTTRAIPTSTSSQTIKSIINDEDFIIKHLKAPNVAVKKTQGATEIFSKPTSPTMNGLLKLAGCNIYGQMYEVGTVITELSNACLECKCLPDIGVGCSPKC